MLSDNLVPTGVQGSQASGKIIETKQSRAILSTSSSELRSVRIAEINSKGALEPLPFLTSHYSLLQQAEMNFMDAVGAILASTKD